MIFVVGVIYTTGYHRFSSPRATSEFYVSEWMCEESSTHNSGVTWEPDCYRRLLLGARGLIHIFVSQGKKLQ